MSDIKKVIKGLERCLICNTSVIASAEEEKAYRDCEYTVGLYCGKDKLLRDTLSLLKEQQEEIENLKQICQSTIEGAYLLKEHEAKTGIAENKLDLLCADGERREE